MLTAVTRRLDDRQAGLAVVVGPLAVAVLACLVLAVVQFAVALPTFPLLAAAIGAAGWVVNAVASVAPALLLVAGMVALAVVSPWFLLGAVALLAGRNRR